MVFGQVGNTSGTKMLLILYFLNISQDFIIQMEHYRGESTNANNTFN